MGKIVICSSCGGSFEDDLGKCPYCGSTHIKGAEQEYMGKLENVRKDMGGLDNAPMEELQKAVKKQGHFLRNAIILILVILAVVSLIIFLLNREEKKDYKEEYLWQQEYFPQLSQLYDDGDYDAMMKLAVQALDENPSATLWTWEHYGFYEVYVNARMFDALLQLEEAGVLSGDDYSRMFYYEWYLVCLEEFDRAEYTEKEWEAFAPYIERAGEALVSDWGMTNEEYQEFLRLAEGNYHSVPYSKCEEYIWQWLKEQE